MIKVTFGKVEMKGNASIICAEATTMLYAIRKHLVESLGEQDAEIIFNDIIENSKKIDFLKSFLEDHR